MKRILITTVMMLFSVVVGKAQTASVHQVDTKKLTENILLNTLKERGYVIPYEEKDLSTLERYLKIDNKLRSKSDSLSNLISTKHKYNFEYGSGALSTQEYTMYEQELPNLLSDIRERFGKIDYTFKDKSVYQARLNGNNPISYKVFLDRYENAVNSLVKPSDSENLKKAVDIIRKMDIVFVQDSVLTASRINKEQKEVSSLPTKTAVKAKFRTYTHRTGNVFELFPVGFTPKPNKAVIDRVFGRKVMYREVDGNGMNTLKIEYYDSGSVLSVTVYKDGSMIYNADYRDHATKAYQILSKSADLKFEVLHKRTYDISNGKTSIDTKYNYLPLDYEYQ